MLGAVFRGCVDAYVGTCILMVVIVAVATGELNAIWLLWLFFIFGFVFFLPLTLIAMLIFHGLASSGKWVDFPFAIIATTSIMILAPPIFGLTNYDSLREFLFFVAVGLVSGTIFWLSAFGRVWQVKLKL